MPMTAILLSSVILATGPDIWAAKLLWITLSGLTVVPVAAIAWALYPTVQVVLLAACGFAFYPFSIYYSTLLLSETPFLLLMTGAVATMLILARDEVRTGKWKGNGLVLGVLLGLLFGVAHLTRPTLVYFFPFVLVWLCVVNHYSWKVSVLSLITFVCVCAPWTVRNYVAFDGAFIPGTLGSGLVMWEGNNPWNDRGGVSQPEWARHLWPPEEVLTSMNEYQIDEWQKSKAIAHIRAEPGRFVRVSLRRFVRFWNFFPNAKEYRSPFYRWVSFVSIAPIVILALVYPLLRWKRWRQWSLVAMLIAYYTVLHVVTIGSIRYRLPLEPTLVAVAAASLVALWSRLTDRIGPIPIGASGREC